MVKKKVRRYTEELKAQVVQEFVSGRKSASELSLEHGISTAMVYKWRVSHDERLRLERMGQLTEQGMAPEHARLFQQKEDEILAYQKKVAEQAIMLDLLKKLHLGKNFQPESELSGLIATGKKLDRKLRPAGKWG